MKFQLTVLILLVSAYAQSVMAHDHCELKSEVRFPGWKANMPISERYTDKYERVLDILGRRNYAVTKGAHKLLIIEKDCKDGKDGDDIYTSCEVKAKIFCEKEQKVVAQANRYFGSSAELDHDWLASRLMLKAVRALPKCQEHAHR